MEEEDQVLVFSVPEAARLLGISRTSLVMRLEAYRIPRPRKKPLVSR